MGLTRHPPSPAARRARTVPGGGENRGNGPLWFWYPSVMVVRKTRRVQGLCQPLLQDLPRPPLCALAGREQNTDLCSRTSPAKLSISGSASSFALSEKSIPLACGLLGSAGAAGVVSSSAPGQAANQALILWNDKVARPRSLKPNQATAPQPILGAHFNMLGLSDCRESPARCGRHL